MRTSCPARSVKRTPGMLAAFNRTANAAARNANYPRPNLTRRRSNPPQSSQLTSPQRYQLRIAQYANVLHPRLRVYAVRCCVADPVKRNHKVKAPTGPEGGQGKRLWLSVADRYVLTAAELGMLSQACRTADELDRLERAVRRNSPNSRCAQHRPTQSTPLLEEVRRHRVTAGTASRPLSASPTEDENVGRAPPPETRPESHQRPLAPQKRTEGLA
jgi:hypothetical protein